jgi:hypothetical protein
MFKDSIPFFLVIKLKQYGMLLSEKAIDRARALVDE